MRLCCSLLFLVLGGACSSGAHSSTGVPPMDDCLIGVRVSPPSASLRFGDSLQAVATWGCPGQPVLVRWRSSDTTVAIVSASGTIRAESRLGTATIVATLVADSSYNGAIALQTIR